jgi:hypothetical protein
VRLVSLLFGFFSVVGFMEFLLSKMACVEGYQGLGKGYEVQATAFPHSLQYF